ncbi:MAG: DUF2339 domain-containing protein [Nanoarchaeota archaeon]|nr:DUF2339 domain-containing protein [Nanoarchaeota archaeon]
MVAGDLEAIKKTLAVQANQIKRINNRLDALEAGDPVPEPEKVEAKATQKASQPAKQTKEISESNPSKNLFRIFGITGIVLIILGMVYFYKYAVDRGWVGITGRIAIGIIISLIFIAVGLILSRRQYEKFGQIIIIGGLGILYFTIFATYHFATYRDVLGMNLTLNTILLLCVMLGGMLIGMRLNAPFVVYGSLLAGFLSAFLSGVSGESINILIYVLVVDIVVLIVAKLKGWYVGIPAQVLTYIAFATWYVVSINSSKSYLRSLDSPLFLVFFFLLIYYALFVILSFIQASKHVEGECLALSIINSVVVTGIGLHLINKQASDFNGMYLMIMAALSIFVGFISQRYKFKNIFSIYFLLTLVLVALAIPVQFDKSIVTILWVVMALGLAFAGLKINDKRLVLVGYFWYIIPLLRAFFYDFWFIDDANRWIAIGSVLIGIIVIQKIIGMFYKNKAGSAFNIYTIVGILLTTVWIAREIFDSSLKNQHAQLLLSLLWALFSIILIAYGVIKRKKVFNWCGVILFGIVILKILIFDLSSLENIYRVLALIIVGVLSLVGSFVFVKNREKIKEFM